MLFFLMLLQGLCFAQADTDDNKLVQGKWKVVTVLENGKSLTEQEIATHLVADGFFSLDGLVISFLPPGQFEAKKIPFVLDSKANPKAIDLMGVNKIGATGIYLLSGDSLMLSFPGANEKARPTDFGNTVGSHRVLVVLQRASAAAKVAATTTPPASTATVGLPKVPPVPTVMQELRQKLIGTWGHQTDEAITYYTLNADGTFSSTIDWKSGLKNAFKSDERSSGTWTLNNGVVVVTITASTDSKMQYQVFSWRITNMGDRDIIAVDNQGRLRHEWKVR